MKKDGIKNHTCYYFHDMIKIENFDFGILLDEKSFKNNFIYDILYKTLIVAKPCISSTVR